MACDGEDWRDHPVLLVKVSNNGRIWSGLSRRVLKPQLAHFGGRVYFWAVKIESRWYTVQGLVLDVWGIDIGRPKQVYYDPTPISNRPLRKAKREVYCYETDKNYPSISEAARDTGLSNSYVNRLAHGLEKSRNWHFELDPEIA